MMPPIRVAHVVWSFDTGGLQNGIVNLANGSDPDRVRHVVISLTDRLGLADRLVATEVLGLSIREGARVDARGAVAGALRMIDPDIVHTRNWSTLSDGVRGARRAGVRRLIHGFHGRDLGNARREKLRRRIAGRLLLAGVDRIVTLTPSMACEFARDFFLRPGRIDVIPNGADLARFSQGVPLEELRSPFTVLFIGRLDPVKNLGLLLRSFREMPGRKPEHRLVIAGDGPEREKLAGLVRELGLQGSAMILGERRDTPDLLASADVYVQPSLYEGMSNTLVEAMAAARPVVATDAGGNADVMGPELAQWLVPSDDAAALAGRLGRLMADPHLRESSGAAGRRRAESEFALPVMVERYTRLYETTAEGSRRER